MSLRIPWDKYEAVLLLDTCIKVINKQISRKKAVTELSESLRHKAVKEGVVIDSVYRNENGISMQLNIMTSIVASKKGGLHNASKLFIDIYNLYKNNNDEYIKILEEAKSKIDFKILDKANNIELKQDELGSRTIDFNNIGELLYTVPVSYKYIQNNIKLIDSWQDLYIEIIKLLSRDYPKVFKNKIPSQSSVHSLYFSDLKDFKRMRKPVKIKDELYAELDIDTESKIRVIRGLLSECGLLFSELIIKYRSTECEEDINYCGGAEQVESSVWSQFVDWLKQNKNSSEVKDIILSLNTLSLLGRRNQTLNKSINMIYDIDEIESIQSKMLSAKNYGITSKKLAHSIKNSLEIYKQFLLNNGVEKSTSNTQVIQTDCIDDNEPINDLVVDSCVNDSSKSVEKEFYEWLSKKVNSVHLSNCYIDYQQLESYCTSKKMLKDKLFCTVDLETLNKIRKLVSGKLLRCINYYIEFVNLYYPNQGKIKNEPISVMNDKINTQAKKEQVSNSEKVKTNTSYFDLLEKECRDLNIEYVDKRYNRGCLWVIETEEAKSFIDDCNYKFGNIFKYAPNGGFATKYKPAWWATKVIKETETPKTSAVSQVKPIHTLQPDKSTLSVRDYLLGTDKGNNSFVQKTEFSQSHSEVENEFRLWLMNNQKLAERTCNSYISAIYTSEKYAIENGLKHHKLFTKDYQEAKATANELYSNKKFSEYNTQQHNRFSASIRHLLKFIANLDNDTEVLEDSSNTASKDKLIHDKRSGFITWLRNKGYTSKDTITFISALKKITMFAIETKLINTDIFLFDEAYKICLLKNQIFDYNGMRELDKKKNNLYANVLTQYIEYLSSISISKPQPQRVDNIEKSDKKSEKVFDKTTIDKYNIILEKYFSESGFQIGRAIYRGRLKKYYLEEFGTEVNESDETIDLILRQVGTERDGRIFPKQGELQYNLIEKIIKDVVCVLDSGACGVHTEALYDKYQKELADNLQIYNEDTLTTLLIKNANGRLIRNRSYITYTISKVQPENDIVNVMKEFHEPKTCEEIHQKLWYIPVEVIKQTIHRIKSVVATSSGAYFYAPNLPISDEELITIKSIVNSELNDRSFINYTEIIDLINSQCPSFEINTSSFSDVAIRKCLGYLLKDDFSFNGKIITSPNKQLRMADVYADFVKNLESFTLSDLEEFSKEMDASIYWSTVLYEAVRVSANLFIRKDLINFDVSNIDNILEDMCPGDYIPLQDISLYLYFPNVGYPWNKFLLESYIYTSSKKFKILHPAFTKSDVYGVMVKSESKFTEYKDVVIDALSKSNSLGSEQSALQFLCDNGFQKKKVLEGIAQIMKEAKLLKENRQNEEM